MEGLKKSVQQCVRDCLQCQMTNLQTPNYPQLQLEVPKIPMGFISMDSIGPFEIMLRRNQYALTVICMFTNYVICVPLVDKSAPVVNAYLKEIYCRFGGR